MIKGVGRSLHTYNTRSGIESSNVKDMDMPLIDLRLKEVWPATRPRRPNGDPFAAITANPNSSSLIEISERLEALAMASEITHTEAPVSIRADNRSISFILPGMANVRRLKLPFL